ncbi:IQ-domain 7 [Arabidopsis lyrata subsp. lyrata]|uniref:IQ-domain 7 n=1 Tax=Arabidopsis lyrata subsp. lyrata TaxID=81972 RepID=D7KFF9_ARALL|nr:protein IQ-DOMAIN 1 isoform X1 [Arabidopsis lyrata subsp. lyrata]EFH69212.1 IQ-domain 7 [Arabidopsis lyrata subsp. lyrata]|eukprot:XP_002892953.1 protein IQ-DOMAIN 1 isoform X1 [Arabidopsis lyrata subsp. lyrata]
MGGSGNWIRSLISHRKPVNDQQEKLSEKSSKKKWKLWRISSESFTSSSFKSRGSYAASSFGSEPPSFSADETFTTAMAALIRAPPKDFLMVKREWASTRIQAAFRAFLARQAFRALKAVVRIQAIFRGRQVRKQAAVTLRCMQALVRVQSRVRAHRRAPSDSIELNDPVKQTEKGWCGSPRSIKEVKTKLQMKQEGAIKRERAMVYALTHQSRTCPSPSGRAITHHGSRKSSPGWNWYEDVGTFSRKSSESSVISEYETVKVRKNNLSSTRVLARPPLLLPPVSSGTSYDSLHDETSTSSTSQSPVAFSSSVLDGGGYYRKPSYMSLTQSTQAKQRQSGLSCNGDARCSAGSDQCTDLYPPGIVTGRHVWAKSQRS